MGLEEIRVNDISTTFTRPKNYIPAIIGGAVFVREKWNTPMGEVYPLGLDELEPHLERIREATRQAVRQDAADVPARPDHQRHVQSTTST